MESQSRTFSHLTVHLHTTPKKLSEDVDPFTMQEVLDHLLGHHDVENFVQGGTPNGKRWALLDHRKMNSCTVLLFSYADQRLADPTMQHLLTGVVETLAPEPDTAWAYAVHLTIDSRMTQYGYYRAVLEYAPRLGKSAVQSFLNFFSRQHSWEIRDGSGREVWPRFEFGGEASTQLKRALEEKRLTGIDVVVERPQRDIGVGEEGFVTHEEALRFQLPRKRSLRAEFRNKDQVGVVKRFLHQAREHGYSSIRVRLSNVGDPTVPASVEISTEEEDAASKMYIKRTMKKFSERLANAHPKIVAEVAQVSIDMLQEGNV